MITTVISFFAALKAGETGARFIAGLIIFAGLILFVGGMIHRHDQRVAAGAAAEAISTVEKANKAAADKADAKQREIMACPAGKWDREADKCNP